MNRLRMRRSRTALTDRIPDFLIGDRFEPSALRHPLPEAVEITNGLLYFGQSRAPFWNDSRDWLVMSRDDNFLAARYSIQ